MTSKKKNRGNISDEDSIKIGLAFLVGVIMLQEGLFSVLSGQNLMK